MAIIDDLSIIIVDDMQFSRAVLQSALKRAGYEDIRQACSGREALQMLAERSADVVLADWVMPEMNGLELTDAIRQNDEDTNRYTSIILFTGKEGNEAMAEAFARGIDDYLTKPVNELELAGRVFASGRIATLQNTLLETTAALSLANKHLEELSTTDPITGLGNRRYLNKQLDTHLLQAHSRGGSICLAIIDIDHFREINDEHGHEVGDEVLVGLSRRLRRAVRPTDVIVRMGGEAFGVLMYYPQPGTYRPSVFDRVLKSIAQRPIQTTESSIAVTVSIGVYAYHGDQNREIESAHEMIKIADENLYKAKENGRNCVITS